MRVLEQVNTWGLATRHEFAYLREKRCSALLKNKSEEWAVQPDLLALAKTLMAEMVRSRCSLVL
jgi:hypothetical protein